MTLARLLVLLTAFGCDIKPLPPAPVPLFDGVKTCTPGVRPKTSDVCVFVMTRREHRPCAVCAEQGCWDVQDATYCVAGEYHDQRDCRDPYCATPAGKK